MVLKNLEVLSAIRVETGVEPRRIHQGFDFIWCEQKAAVFNQPRFGATGDAM